MATEKKSLSKPSIALFGATGGSVQACLVLALKNGYTCSALARTPSKLTNLLKSSGVSEEQIQTHLTIIEGDAKDTAKVAETLSINDTTADIILSGVGSYPVWLPNPLRPTFQDPTVCQDITTTILDALKTLQSKNPPKKPIFIMISGTGITEHNRDIPIAMIPLYHWLLPIPHNDKKVMERIVMDEVKPKADGTSGVIEGFISIRPSLLTTKPGLGIAAIRAAPEIDGKIPKEAIGYTISRVDVGAWIFEVLLEKPEKRVEYLNRGVCITT